MKEEHRLITRLINNVELGEQKPYNITEEQWDIFKNIENDIVTKYSLSVDNICEARMIELETLPLKKKIEKQLDIIHNLINYPKSIDRIEDYEDSFSPGNFDNLRKIARLLKQRN